MNFEELIENLTKGSGLKRAQAAADIGKLKDKRASDALIKALSDQNAGVRNNAAFALGEIGAIDSVPHLISILKKDQEEWVRKSAAKALGILGANSAVMPLVEALDDPSLIIRKNAVRSLGKIGGPDAVQALARAASGLDPIVAKMAKEALEKLKNG